MTFRLRIVLWLTFVLSNAALIMFALLPMSNVIFAEVVVILLAGIAMVTVTINAFHPTVWSGYGYLLTGAVSLYTVLAFLFTASDLSEEWVPAAVLALLSSSVLGYTVHIALEEDSVDA
jgi:uncharacterized membrane protein HdeD (DUF308 family)